MLALGPAFRIDRGHAAAAGGGDGLAGDRPLYVAAREHAVASDFERLAEAQEEILWMSEAAHFPVIRATQVLETLAKEDMPSRAEITDAAMGHHAECVMLDKGPHVVCAVRVLDGILRRMQSHQARNRAILRELRLAHAPSSAPSGEDTPNDGRRVGRAGRSVAGGAARAGRRRGRRRVGRGRRRDLERL